MFFFFPVNTDAPIYYWPFITVGLIVVNTLVFLGVFTGYISDPGALVLEYGNGLHPLQWVTSNFIHEGWVHLLGNMLFLWGFGLVVEGKTGWWRFLIIYLGIGIVQCAGEQILMMIVGGNGGSCGASSVIFGLTAISWIWAPKNEMQCVLVLIIFRVHVQPFSATILSFGGWYIALQIVLAMLTGFSVSSATLHLAGAVLGIIVGFAMLVLKLVDCEGWDIISVWQGRSDFRFISEMRDHGPTTADAALGKPVGDSNASPSADGARQAEGRLSEEDRDEAHKKMRQALQQSELEAAINLHNRLSQYVDDWQLDRAELTGVTRLLHAKKRWVESVPFMEEYLRRFPDTSGRIRVKLAQIYIVEQERPSKGHALLKEIRAGGLDQEVGQLRTELMVQARKMIDSGVLELQDEND